MIPLLQVDKWMTPAHCLPDAWFRWFVFLAGAYVAIMYFIFAYQVLHKLKEPLSNLIHTKFPQSLGVVFFFCALAHGIHSASYLSQYFKLALLAVYPFLCYYHTVLLFSAKKAIQNLKGLYSEADVEYLQYKKNALEKENVKLIEMIDNALKKKDLEILSKIINEQ